jgi:acyl dehydratase
MSALPERTVGPVERVSFVRWIGAIDDVDSPVHYDRVVAREQGHEDVLAPGMLQAAMLADHATSLFGAERLRACRWRFVDVVWPGDVLTLRGSSTPREDGTVDVELECLRGDDNVAVRCWMTFAPDPESAERDGKE